MLFEIIYKDKNKYNVKTNPNFREFSLIDLNEIFFLWLC